jgi:hypothetical protein
LPKQSKGKPAAARPQFVQASLVSWELQGFVVNHPNFPTIDPITNDAGLKGLGTGFGDPSLTNTTYPGSNNSTRRITFYGVFRF